jgi:hypothetical protein
MRLDNSQALCDFILTTFLRECGDHHCTLQVRRVREAKRITERFSKLLKVLQLWE